MKVLLCTPYDFSGKTPGGISVWAKNIIEYSEKHPQNITIDIYDCTRSSYINENTGRLRRIYCGIKDYFRFITDICQRVKKYQYQVVHINTTASISTIKDIILCLLLKWIGVHVFLHYHFGRIPSLYEQNNKEWKLVYLSIKLAYRAIVMDHQSFVALEKAGLKNIVEIPNPYSPFLETSVSNMQKETQRKKNRILFLGRVYKKKGIYELVEACTKIENIELRIVGPYDEQDKQNLQNIAPNTDWIEFVGPIKHEEVIKELLSCEMLVMPTYTEGFPNVVLEAMITQTPIIVTPVGAIPQMLDFENAPCGISIRPKSIEDIVKAIETLLGNKELQDNMTRMAFERVKRTYNVETVGEMLYRTWES